VLDAARSGERTDARQESDRYAYAILSEALAMPAEGPYEFPKRPFSIEEALDLRNQAETFVHTTPMIGLKAAETGQAGAGSRS
jgi:hypothetical protein